ncbi:MAG: nucleoside 2-deoxyribosyltransferase domain-containing protein [Clostridia bacterium]|nr:nucleoside 2-deoxyribosyltransferase domain-containing protein [Clostridia bacterium]
MILNYSDQKVINSKKSIFLAGPLPRKKEIKNWKDDVLKYLKELKYDGVVYIPEKRNHQIIEGDADQTNWEMEAMNHSKVLLFWIPRSFPDMLGLTTNVEFGIWLSSGKILYGRPDDAYMIEYLDLVYDKYYHKKPYNNLFELVKEAVKINN